MCLTHCSEPRNRWYIPWSRGCLNDFLQFLDQAPLSDMKPYTQFLGQGKMPYMLFGLPAAALAIYRTTPQDKKAKVKALMIAGVAACFVSGITEST